MNPSSPTLAIVCPLGNERRSIAPFLRAVVSHLGARDRMFCVLDNVAQDGTRDYVEQQADRDERIVALWCPQNRSVVDAYFAGYRAAYDSGADAILEMDAGFSHPPELIPRFRAAIAEGYDFVGGSRFKEGGRYAGTLQRRVFSQGGSVLARRVLRSQMTDMTGGYECFSRPAMEYVLEHGVRSRANFFQTEIRHMMHRFRWKEIPFTYSNDAARVGRSAVGESFRNLFHLARHHES